ncbi:hypothetical protein ACHAQA_003462 [Verticillium albo-atrum]
MKVDFFQVAESAFEEQCPYCYVIYHSLIAMGCDVSMDGFSVLALHATPGAPFYVLWDDARLGRSVIEVFRERHSPSLLNELGPADCLAQDIRQAAVYDPIRRLLSECENTHPACSQVEGDLPRRLLYIGSSALLDLRVTDVFPADVRYVALSHCWGPDTPFTTTWATLAQREAGIEWSDLPLTFQDAITVARHLDVEYIWIDSLCIIQDDKGDWAVESLKMGSIYERAYLTVAAATSVGDREGFLGPTRQREYYKSSTIDMHPFGEVSGVQVRRAFDVRATPRVDPLYTRGWTFQERIMPRRILTFSSAIIFECHTTTSCETGRSVHADPFYCASIAKTHDNIFRDKERQFVDLLRRGTDSSSLYKLWVVVIEQMTMREMTYQRDMLPAISALARRFQVAQPHDTYAAGLWCEYIAFFLSWDTRGAGRALEAQLDSRRLPKRTGPPRTTRTYRAPSWSWASVDGPCVFALTDLVFDDPLGLKLLDMHTDVNKTNPFGEVTGGWLRIRGLVATAKLIVTLSIDKDSAHDKVPFKQTPRTAIKSSAELTLVNENGTKLQFQDDTALTLDCPVEPRVVLDGAITTAARVADGGNWVYEEGTYEYTVQVLLLGYAGRHRCFYSLLLGNNGLYGDEATCFERLGLADFITPDLVKQKGLWRWRDIMII